MSQAPDVLLITRDARLQAAVSAARPRGARLSVLPEADWRVSGLSSARQTWIDLATATTNGAPTTGQRLVYFASGQTTPPADWPIAPCIAKPLRAMTAEILWADSGPFQKCAITNGPQPIPSRSECPASPNSAWLPGWTTELQLADFFELRRALVEMAPRRLGYAVASLYLRAADSDEWALAESCGAELAEAATTAVDDLAALAALPTASALLLFQGDPGRWCEAGDAELVRAADAMLLPLRANDALVGALTMCGRRGTHAVHSADELVLLAKFFGNALALARQLDQSQKEARVDALTGLYNYRWMRETLRAELRRAERHRTPVALLALDLDHLKKINDQHGHGAGDAALRCLAARIASPLRQFDSAARVGGDEFLVLLPATGLDGAQKVAQRILSQLTAAELTCRGAPILLSASIGAAQSARGDTLDMLVQAADLAMFAAKRAGGGRVTCAGAGEASGIIHAMQPEPVALPS